MARGCRRAWESVMAVRKGKPHNITNPPSPGLILTTSIFALPLALAAFPQRQEVQVQTLEREFWERGGKEGRVEFNRGI